MGHPFFVLELVSSESLGTANCCLFREMRVGLDDWAGGAGDGVGAVGDSLKMN
jgi:hypothetical protein